MEQQISYVAIPSDNHNYDCFLNNSISALILCVKQSILNCKGMSENNRKNVPEKLYVIYKIKVTIEIPSQENTMLLQI